MTLTDITIPTPAAYDSADPHKQRENLCYVFLQLLTKMQTAGTDIDLVGAVSALQFNGESLDFGDVRLTLSNRSGVTTL